MLTFFSQSEHTIEGGVPRCPMCPEVTFSYVATYRRHMKKHRPNPKQHYCSAPGCKRSFEGYSRKDELNRHLRVCSKLRHIRETENTEPFARTAYGEPREISATQSDHAVADLEQTMMRSRPSQSERSHAQILENLEICRQSQMVADCRRRKAWEDFCFWDALYHSWTPNIDTWEAYTRRWEREPYE